MASVTTARRIAATVLRVVSRGRRLDLAFSEAAESLPRKHRPWLQEVVYGVVRLQGRLDHLLDKHLRQGVESVSPPVLELLRLGAYQLLYMDGVPAYAAISQTVDQVREKMGAGGGRLANAVLRSLDRTGGGESRFPDFSTDPVGYLTTWGSHPAWMVERWVDRWGAARTLALVELNNTPPSLYFRPLGLSPAEAAIRLREAGMDPTVMERGIPCIRLADGTNPATVLDRVPGIIQDPGAALVTEFADPPPGVMVVDLCAAPGGKAMALGHGRGPGFSSDRSQARMRVLRENFRRLDMDGHMVVSDARKPPLRRAEFVLLDVPCTGTGTFRRHPDARWRLRPESLGELVELQAEILAAAGTLVPSGGHLVYSTCSLEEEENEGQVSAFLDRNPAFTLDGSGRVPERFLAESGFLRVLPQDSGFDGSFAARLVRTA